MSKITFGKEIDMIAEGAPQNGATLIAYHSGGGGYPAGSLLQKNSAGEISYVGGGVGVQVVQITTQLLAASWNLVSGLYEYDLANVNITATSIVDVIPDNTYIDIIKVAEILPQTLSGNGTVKLYSTNLPTVDIVVTINIWK